MNCFLASHDPSPVRTPSANHPALATEPGACSTKVSSWTNWCGLSLDMPGFMKGVFWLEVDRLVLCLRYAPMISSKHLRISSNAFKRLFAERYQGFVGISNNCSLQPILGVVFWTKWTSMNHLVCDVFPYIYIYIYIYIYTYNCIDMLHAHVYL